ncbi:MAG: phosphoenolpyruvate--protein phosphotransferase [Akkermansiaceae bacterium]
MQNILQSLQHLVQQAAVAATPQKRVLGIVSRIKKMMEVGVCSLYLMDKQGGLVMAATEGLHPQCVGTIRLKLGEGLVGTIAATQHPLNVQNASKHPNYRYFPESGEQHFDSFLGAPVVHEGKLVGVLVVEQVAHRKFTDDEESFLITAAAHLGSLSPSDFQISDPLEVLDEAATESLAICKKGIAASSGVGAGKAVVVSGYNDLMSVKDAEVTDIEAELQLLDQAIDTVDAELAVGRAKLLENLSEDVAEMFDVYAMMLRSTGFIDEVRNSISHGVSAASALRTTVTKQANKFKSMENEYLSGRAEDVINLGNKIYAHLIETTHVDVDENDQIVLVGALVSITDIAKYSSDRLVGIVSSEGSSLSHTAVLAKALGVPAVVGVRNIRDLPEGEEVIVDGYQGEVHVFPSPELRAGFQKLIEFEKSLKTELSKLKDLPAITPDGARMKLYANTGLVSDITPGLANGAEGIGLYRSEIPFIISETFPSEDEQFHIYQEVLNSYAPKSVCMRTLDIGGDKPLPYYQINEENPALGWRGIRFTMDNSVIFMTQVRAMLRASEGLESLRIMLPMISAMEEVESCLVQIDSALEQLKEEGIVVTRPLIGIMAEVPAVVAILPFLKGKIDFVSIGSNDLTQYILAVDRGNSHVIRLYDYLHPAVIHTVESIVLAAKDMGIPVSVCGEMAADPCAAVLLLGMKLEILSMVAFSIPRIKWLIRTISQKDAVEQLEIAKKSSRPCETRAQLETFLTDRGLGDLLRSHT